MLRSRGPSAYKEKKKSNICHRKVVVALSVLFLFCLSHSLHFKLLHDKNVSSPTQKQPTKKPDLNMLPNYRNPALRWELEGTAEVGLFLKTRQIQLSGDSQI